MHFPIHVAMHEMMLKVSEAETKRNPVVKQEISKLRKLLLRLERQGRRSGKGAKSEK